MVTASCLPLHFVSWISIIVLGWHFFFVHANHIPPTIQNTVFRSEFFLFAAVIFLMVYFVIYFIKPRNK